MINLEDKTLAELKELAKENNIKNISKLKKEELVQVLEQVINSETISTTEIAKKNETDIKGVRAMKMERHSKIVELIGKYEIETQDKLASLLREFGYEVTQATISRDIKELHLIKILSSTGKYKYAVAATNDTPISGRLSNIFRETVKSTAYSGNIVLLKTLSGCASAAAEALDSSGIPHVIGSVAGDNTIMFVTDDPENSPIVVEFLNNMLKK